MVETAVRTSRYKCSASPDAEGIVWSANQMPSALEVYRRLFSINALDALDQGATTLDIGQNQSTVFRALPNQIHQKLWGVDAGSYIVHIPKDWELQPASEIYGNPSAFMPAFLADHAPKFEEIVFACPVANPKAAYLSYTLPNNHRFVTGLNQPTTTAAQVERFQRIAAMARQLQEFSVLPENWNSYGASAPTSEVIGEARRILTAVINLGLPEPWTAPGGDGGIGIQWETDRVELYIDIVPGEATTYVLTPKTGGATEIEGLLTLDNLHEVLGRFGDAAI
ncbi:MAG: hypothetical protein OXL97_08885 [Chloroflexota bacterium]|nr:hypothetical protein [Chloroflexota bacterium]MDE2885454.1 hypothetical protein [Chloroflexota bacterium]